jgi:hypothetical protein
MSAIVAASTISASKVTRAERIERLIAPRRQSPERTSARNSG